MIGVRQITVGVGLHPRTGKPDVGSVRAALQAAWIAARVDAKVTLLCAAWADDSSGPVELGQTAMEELTILSGLVGDHGVQVEIEVVEDYPWHALVARALAGKADLVVAGKRATEGSVRRRIGSTAVKLLRKCPVPVWLVKPDHDLMQRHVLAATDFSEVSSEAVDAAAWVAEQSEGELHVFHAWNLTPIEMRAAADLPQAEYDALIESHRTRALSELERQVGGLDVDPTLHLERGVAHAELLREAEEEHPDLIVMGTLSRGGRSGFLVGTTAERLVGQVDESLLCFKPRDFESPVVLPDAGG